MSHGAGCLEDDLDPDGKPYVDAEEKALIAVAKAEFVAAGHKIESAGIHWFGGPLAGGGFVCSGHRFIFITCSACTKMLEHHWYRDDDAKDWGDVHKNYEDHDAPQPEDYFAPRTIISPECPGA